MDVKKIDHVGIAVKSIDDAIGFYTNNLGLESTAYEVVESQGVRVAFIKVGESLLELLEPLNENSTIAKFIAKRGEGLHHICFGVNDVTATLAEMKVCGLQLIDEQPRPGAHHKHVAFLHPKSSNGVLVEFSQDAPGYKDGEPI